MLELYNLLMSILRSIEIVPGEPIGFVEDVTQEVNVKKYLYSVTTEKMNDKPYKDNKFRETDFLIRLYCNDLSNGDLGVKYLREKVVEKLHKQRFDTPKIQVIFCSLSPFVLTPAYSKTNLVHLDSVQFTFRWRLK